MFLSTFSFVLISGIRKIAPQKIASYESSPHVKITPQKFDP